MHHQHSISCVNLLPTHRKLRHRGVVRLSIRHAAQQRNLPRPIHIAHGSPHCRVRRQLPCHLNLLLFAGHLQHVRGLRVGQPHRRIDARPLVPHVIQRVLATRRTLAQDHLARPQAPRHIQHRAPTRDRRVGNRQPPVVRVLRIPHHRIHHRVRPQPQCRTQLHLDLRALHVPLHIQVVRPPHRCPVKRHPPMQRQRNRRRPLPAVLLKAQRMQQLIELAQIANRRIHLQVRQRIAILNPQNPRCLGR